jgi:ribosomal protein S18 acetylase RimI-like enzyme
VTKKAMIIYSSELDGIDWHEAAQVVEKAPLGKRDPDELRQAFMASYAAITVHDDAKLIGLARALCDGQYQAAIYDVVILPEYQGQGVGREIMRRLRDMLPVKNVILYAAPGRQGFYAKLGYKKMLTAMAILNPALKNIDQFLADE